jgi:NADH dehydrogenase (ubiquinone) 1 alpha subcomplex subunit 10
MALSAARATLVNHAAIKTLLGRHGGVVQIQVATLKATFGEKYPYSKAWPYETRKFNLFHEIYDNSIARINENSKVIVVEGNVGAGKNEFAKRLAKNFDLRYIPGVTEDFAFTNNEHKFDLRCTDDLLTESAQQYTNKKLFHDAKPESGIAGKLQFLFYKARFDQYYKALLHLFSTGQGVVVVRSAFSDRVFADVFRKMGWLTRPYMPWYTDLVDNSLCALLRPHVTVYLDTPVDVCMKNTKAKGRVEEQGKNFSEAYLSAIEAGYKNVFLPRQRLTHEVMEIDWSVVGDEMDMDVITEEIAQLHLDSSFADDPKFEDWRKLNQDLVGHYRKLFASDWQMEHFVRRPMPMHMPEMMGSDEDNLAREKILWEHPGLQYRPGYVRAFGDKPPMFKM